MIYFIKALYNSVLLPPGIFILSIAIFVWKLYKKEKRYALYLLCVVFLLYLFSTGIISHMLLANLEYRYIPPQDFSGDVLVVLGAGGVDTSPNIGFRGHVGQYAANRMLTAYSLYQKTSLPILVSGGKLYGMEDTEAHIHYKILSDLNIPKDKIILEDQSQNTAQNAEFSSKILRQMGFHNPILITSAFHMQRAVLEFEKQGIHVLPFPAGYSVPQLNRIDGLDWIPTAASLDKTALALKEWLGIFKIKFLE